MTAAFRLAQLERCSETVEASCLRRVRGGDDLHDSILGNLRKLSFSPPMMKGGNKEVEGTQHHFTRNGRLVANKQQVYTVDRFAGLQQVGWYSEDEGLNLDGGVDEVLPTTVEPVYSPLVNNNNGNGLSERERSTFARSVDPSDLQSEASSSSSNSLDGGIRIMKTPRELETLPIFSYESFISRTWALVVVSAAIFGFLASLWMLLYVFQKICDGTLAGNQAMGVLLLLGVMALFASVVPWLLPPSETMCALRHFVHPLLLVLCFSILLVKSMQLRSLITIGLGGRIPQVNQLISLFFMVMVQVVIAAEWYLATRPIGIQIIAGYPECGVSPSRFLLLHIYPTVLLLLTFFYGVSVLKVKRNFNEGRWITCAAVFIIPVFAAWPVVYYFAPVPFHDPSVAVSVVAVAGVLLACVFLPKMHTIALQARIKEASDLSRTCSDTTVYTGFSDYAAFSSKPLYPVYGYTTNQFVPQMAAAAPAPVAAVPLSSSSRSRSTDRGRHGKKDKKKSKSKWSRSKSSTGNFRNINYVPHGHHVKSYSEWSREYDPALAASVAAAAAANSQHNRLHRGVEQHHYHHPHQLQHQMGPVPDHYAAAVYSISSHGRPHHHHSHQAKPHHHHPRGRRHRGGREEDEEELFERRERRHHRRQVSEEEEEEDEAVMTGHETLEDSRHGGHTSSRLSAEEEDDVETELEEISSSNHNHIHGSSLNRRVEGRRATAEMAGGGEAPVDDLDLLAAEEDEILGGAGYFDKSANGRFRRRRHSRSPSDGMILTASGLSEKATQIEQQQQQQQQLGEQQQQPGYRVSEVFLTH